MQIDTNQQQTAPTLTMPQQTLLQGREYTSAAGTDVQATWRKFGWTPTTDEERAARNKEKPQ